MGEGESGASKARSKSGSISDEFAALKDTRWHWNNWRDVIFRADGGFLAPGGGCEREGNPNCKWWSDDERLFVKIGNAGVHTLTLGIDGTTMSGSRDSDGEE